MSQQFWVLTRIAGWIILLAYFLLELFQMETGKKFITGQREMELRYLTGTVGVFLVLIGYIMLNI